ncbi:cytochrome bd-I ubiquinol oxidase subunit 2 apoprotein [Spirosomataceae bacterium TFI 002]|nr:cytochrome bd-I ubiquinol oxidase subunit 2 apoprotein [Spirosomataceae bacterium TFI 002]
MEATILGLDYPTLWFLVVGGLFAGYAILDGFDFGAGAWHLFFKKEESRRIALNAVGPVWDGNEVWLVIGGGALFAGFPIVYATLFSGLYVPFMLFIFSLIFRAISIEFRSKETMLWWRKTWDISYSISSILLATLLGVVLGNVLQGLPIGKDGQLQMSLFEVLNPFSIVIGITTLALFMMHGGIYLIMKTEGRLFAKIGILTKRSVWIFVALFAVSTTYVLLYIPHLSNGFKENPVLSIIPFLGMLSIANIPRLLSKKNFFRAFIFSAISIALFLFVVAIELYPSILISSIDPSYDISIYDAASSEKTLGIMLFMAAIGTPIILTYTIFVYKTFKGKVRLDETSY